MARVFAELERAKIAPAHTGYVPATGAATVGAIFPTGTVWLTASASQLPSFVRSPPLAVSAGFFWRPLTILWGRPTLDTSRVKLAQCASGSLLISGKSSLFVSEAANAEGAILHGCAD